MEYAVAIGIVLIALFIWLRYFHISRPDVPPIQIDPNDPLIIDARRKAKESIPRFRELASQPNRGTRVQIPFLSNSGVTENLWAEVLKFHESEMDMRYLTPPVTHTGTLERLHTHSIESLIDWQIELPSGKYEGGFAMRASFVIARKQWGSLPPELEAEEKKYEETGT